MQVLASDTHVPIKVWASDVEEGALKQAVNLASLPFAFHHVALMPDCHRGYGMPIGGVDDLDEASSAYKDIDVVMENQKDLVKIVHKLTPLGVIKG